MPSEEYLLSLSELRKNEGVAPSYLTFTFTSVSVTFSSSFSPLASSSVRLEKLTVISMLFAASS